MSVNGQSRLYQGNTRLTRRRFESPISGVPGPLPKELVAGRDPNERTLLLRVKRPRTHRIGRRALQDGGSSPERRLLPGCLSLFQRFAKHVLVRPAAGAASCQLAID